MKDIIILVLYQWVYYLVKCIPAKVRPNHLLILKTDEIGDYMLFRNMLQEFKKSDVYKGYHITLAGNAIFKQLFDAYDADSVNEAIWINKKKFRTNLLYRFRILKAIRKAGYSDIVNVIHSRSFRVDDAMAAVSTAPNKTAMSSQAFYWSAFEKLLVPASIYTRIIGEEGSLFDAWRNARFIEQLLQAKISPSTGIDANGNIQAFQLPARYFVVFPGSGLKDKKWPAEHFAQVAGHIIAQYGILPVVCGSTADKPDATAFISLLKSPVTDLTGKTTLPEFLTILKNAICLISVDTGSVHLAAAVQCPVFALFSGIHYGRFAPYPKEIAQHFYPVYPDMVDEKIANNQFSALQDTPVGLLNKIPPEKMILAIDQYLPLVLSERTKTNLKYKN